jgi:nitrile hydratase
MNGVHDMGGMQDMGPIQHESDEPVFHAPWEGRAYALNRALRAWGKWNLDASRHEIELLPPADYLRMSYYEKWLQTSSSLAVKHGLITQAELESGKPEPGSPKATPPLTAGMSSGFLSRGIPSSRDPRVRPLFRVGQRVRARNLNPPGHTRLPRYARGKPGVIHRLHGIHVFPDTNAHGLGERPQPLYSVRFDARALWGESAEANHQVHLDLWESYLRPADDRP